MAASGRKSKPVIPAKAGIQIIKDFPCKRDNIIMTLSASQGFFYDWIPAFAGMTPRLSDRLPELK
jgi:hypothetical protein